MFTHLLARAVVACLLVAVVFFMIRKDPVDNHALAGRFLIPTALMFFLSPTQFPWYFLWLLPFLALRTSFALLLLTALLPIYYLRFYFEARQATDFFDDWIVWLQYVPVWLFLIYETLRPNALWDAKETDVQIERRTGPKQTGIMDGRCVER
jgi:hypothetical protein